MVPRSVIHENVFLLFFCSSFLRLLRKVQNYPQQYYISTGHLGGGIESATSCSSNWLAGELKGRRITSLSRFSSCPYPSSIEIFCPFSYQPTDTTLLKIVFLYVVLLKLSLVRIMKMKISREVFKVSKFIFEIVFSRNPKRWHERAERD